MLRLPGHTLSALAKAREIVAVDERARTADGNQALTITVVMRRDDPIGFKHYLHDVL